MVDENVEYNWIHYFTWQTFHFRIVEILAHHALHHRFIMYMLFT